MPSFLEQHRRSVLSRREALIGLVALFGGGVLAAPSVAAASSGTMQFGAANDAGTSWTSLQSSTGGGATLVLTNTGTAQAGFALAAWTSAAAATAPAIFGQTLGLGPAISGELDGPTSSTAPAVLGTSNSKGPGVQGLANALATGHGVEGLIQNVANPSAAVRSSCQG